ncbi:hypothetical protein E3N88_08128 [Mikania micrantha]|uniref:non-specific serine/threonine protein kinase n=1 Tax=Mikania micrantha TaxID=192012 RepID=A0A5N6PHF7_9ASTR|nr:hypothetical protein E3N88_08128 [Mikania micrantha]
MEKRLMLPYASEEVPNLSIAFADTELEIRSWNLFAVLLSIGRPVPPIELASRCNFIKVSQEFIKFKADQADLKIPLLILNAHGKACIQVDDTLRGVIMNTGSTGASYNNSTSTLIKFDAGNFSYGLNGKREDEKEIVTIMSMKELGNQNNFSTSISVGLKDCFQFPSSSHLTASSLLRVEDISGERCLLSKKSSTSTPADDNNKVISLVKGWINNGSSKANNNLVARQRFTEGRDYECILESESHNRNLENLSHNIVYGGMLSELYVGSTNTLYSNDMTPCPCEFGEQNLVPPTDTGNLRTNEAQMDDLQEEEKTVCGRKESVCSLPGEQDRDLLMSMDKAYKEDCTMKNSVRCKLFNTEAELDLMNSTRELISYDQKHLPESTSNLKGLPRVTSSTAQRVYTKINKENDVGSLEQKCGKKDKRSTYVKQKLKLTSEQTMHTIGRENIKENKEKAPASSVKGHSEPKVLPVFDSYIVEEEEGSGGYGTVYKTRRKKDGTMFAVKYPHVNANRQHVYNEVKMLERFGGKNFVIKYEGSFKNGNSHCLVLEHVAHDRPEVLKREIDVFQLRWYGYCLFRALASLHKQGVVHRDVKPGNFLFSRKASKGYLIDFNLATDLHQKLGFTGKYKSHNDASSMLVPSPHPEILPPARSSKYASSKALAAETHSKMLLFPKNLKKKKDQKNLNVHGVMKSQGADGSGITSTKDATSTKVPSGERFREPIPCKGRKEYLNLVHEALQSPDHDATVGTTLVSKRKRVAAPPAKLDNKFLYPTPMPLQSTGIGLLKNKGDGKQRKEGPCVGTKGFRAPEVLLKSTYQGPKVDIWSAGVTLLYFIIGRTPFVGDPDQNIKEIAKLRGSEDLWEVAKLHDRESSFPLELLQVQSLASTKLQEWCKQNTRRPDFLAVIPKSLIDLVDKCLTVNPRSRFSAEEALRHEFFVPCVNDLEKQRLIRQKLAHSNSQSALS